MASVIGPLTRVLVVTFHRATGVPSHMMMKPSPIANVHIDHGIFDTDVQRHTESITSTHDPVWEESVAILIGEDVDRIKLEVKTGNGLTGHVLGHCQVSLSENHVKKEIALEPQGLLYFSAVALPVQVAAGLALNYTIPAGFQFKLAGPKGHHFNRLIVVNVNSAHVADVNLIGHRDPYLYIHEFIGGKASGFQLKGKIHRGTTHPIFNETFVALVEESVSHYRLEIRGHQLVGHAALGYVDLALGGRGISKDFDLEPRSSKGERHDVNLQAYHVPLELIVAVSQGAKPFVAPRHTVIEPGAGFNLAVWYLSDTDAYVEVTGTSDGATIGSAKAEAKASGVTSVSVPFDPDRVLDIGKHISLVVSLRRASDGAELAQSSISLVVGTGDQLDASDISLSTAAPTVDTPPVATPITPTVDSSATSAPPAVVQPEPTPVVVEAAPVVVDPTPMAPVVVPQPVQTPQEPTPPVVQIVAPIVASPPVEVPVVVAATPPPAYIVSYPQASAGAAPTAGAGVPVAVPVGVPGVGHPGANVGAPHYPNRLLEEPRLHAFLTKYQVDPKWIHSLEKLREFESILILDDSGSMVEPSDSNHPSASRWQELEQSAAVVLELLGTLGIGSHVYFLNRGAIRGVTSFSQIAGHFVLPPDGGTHTVHTLEEITREHNLRDPPKPVIIHLFTDGHPTNKHGHTDMRGFYNWLQERPRFSNGHYTSKVSIVLCTDDEEIEKAYRPLEYNPGSNSGIAGVDVTEDYRGESRDVRTARNNPAYRFTFGDYIVKTILGAADPNVHLMDLPGYIGATPSYYGLQSAPAYGAPAYGTQYGTAATPGYAYGGSLAYGGASSSGTAFIPTGYPSGYQPPAPGYGGSGPGYGTY